MAKKLSIRPAQRTEEQEMTEFIQGANTAYPPASDKPIDDSSKPWLDPKVRDDVIKMVSLRMPEAYIMKLQYLSDKTNLSQQEILRRVIIPWIDAEVEKY